MNVDVVLAQAAHMSASRSGESLDLIGPWLATHESSEMTEAVHETLLEASVVIATLVKGIVVLQCQEPPDTVIEPEFWDALEAVVSSVLLRRPDTQANPGD